MVQPQKRIMFGLQCCQINIVRRVTRRQSSRPARLRRNAHLSRSGRNLDHLCLRIEPFDEAAIVRHLAAHGLAPHGPASSNFGAEGDGPSLYLGDPDGNTVELKGPSR